MKKTTGITSGLILVCYGSKIEAVELDSERFNAKDVKHGYNYGIDKFYGQGDFENARKSGTAAAFIISQAPEYRRVIKIDSGYIYKTNKAACLIDNGGNNLDETRNALQRRLNAFKAKRRATEAANKDYTADVARVRQAFEVLRALLIQSISIAQSSEDYSKIGNVAGWPLRSLAADIRDIERHTKANDFPSVQRATEAISGALSDIQKLQTALKA